MELPHSLQGGMPLADGASYRGAMRELAAGVSIVTAGASEARRGATVTAVCSVSADPPTLLVCVDAASESHKAIAAAGAFCVNVLPAGRHALANRFAGRGGVRGADRFAEGGWETLETGAPVLSDALAAFDCRLVERLSWGTHTIFLGAVVAARARSGLPALVYRDGAYSHA